MMYALDDLMVGPLNEWKSNQALDIARAMTQLAKQPTDYIEIQNQEIKIKSSAYRV